MFLTRDSSEDPTDDDHILVAVSDALSQPQRASKLSSRSGGNCNSTRIKTSWHARRGTSSPCIWRGNGWAKRSPGFLWPCVLEATCSSNVKGKIHFCDLITLKQTESGTRKTWVSDCPKNACINWAILLLTYIPPGAAASLHERDQGAGFCPGLGRHDMNTALGGLETVQRVKKRRVAELGLQAQSFQF